MADPSTGRPPVSGATRLAAVIGDPVRHSLSPALHNAAFEASGLDWVYLALPTPPGRASVALDAVRHLDLAGLSVTMPHKAEVVPLLDELSPAAKRLGAVNCIVPLADGRLRGENTDGGGFVDQLDDEVGWRPAGRDALVIGSGGAARSVIEALAEAGATRVLVAARRPEAAQAAAALAGEAGGVAPIDAASEVDLVVNATPIGMSHHTGAAMPCPPELVGEGQIVADLVYQPLETEWVGAARRRGATAIGGVGMLLHQAARAFTHWTGRPAPLPAMRAAVAAHLE